MIKGVLFASFVKKKRKHTKLSLQITLASSALRLQLCSNWHLTRKPGITLLLLPACLGKLRHRRPSILSRALAALAHQAVVAQLENVQAKLARVQAKLAPELATIF